MKASFQLAARLCLLAALAAVPSLWAQKPRSDINTPAARAAVLTRAEKLLKRNTDLSEALPSEMRNPFVAEATEPAPDARSKSSLPRDDRERVAFLAGLLSPTGAAERDGEQFLLFGQRKVKVGETLPVAFENAQFDLEIVAIERGTFTVRLNRQEFTRPIKPGKTP